MKTAFFTALFFVASVSSAFAQEFGRPFVLAMDYSVLTRLAQADTLQTARAKLNDAEPFVQKTREALKSETNIEDDAKFQQVKDFSKKPRSLSGGANFDADDGVSVAPRRVTPSPKKTNKKTRRTKPIPCPSASKSRCKINANRNQS